MKNILFALTVFALLPAAQAQDRIYRCGNQYTNDASKAKDHGCRLLEGGNVTVLSPTGSSSADKSTISGSRASSSPPANAPRVTKSEQSARDADARSILEAELRKAENRLEELRSSQKAEGNDSARAAEIKASVATAQADIEGLKRELARLTAR